MSIKPIDYQITINKANDFTKDANLIKTKPNIEQNQFSEELQKKKIQEERKVNVTTEIEYNRINGKKQGEDAPSKRQEKRKEKKNTNMKKKTINCNNNSSIDIKI